tara:strand:+ start:1131 stop:1268 length:138 start_codon:yes stop_codon:yes gene_type:complete
MLFNFGKFWQTIAIILSSWIVYGIWDFEFATVTLLALIFASKLNN